LITARSRPPSGTESTIEVVRSLCPEAARAASTNPARTETIIAHHTTPDQAGLIFSRVKPRLAVYSHAVGTVSVIEQTRKTYSGPLQGAEDLLTIDIGDQVVVRHFGP
jgi:ribonuclease Z